MNDVLLDVYPGRDRNLLTFLKIDGNKIILKEGYPSEEPPFEHSYYLDYFNSYKKHRLFCVFL